MAENIMITRAGINDAETLAALSITTFRETFEADNGKEDMDKYVAEELSHVRLTEELNNTDNYFFLAWYDDALVGYMKIRPNKEPGIEGSNPLEIERIYVSQQYHGRKIGATMMQYCIDFAHGQKHDTLWLGVWEHNHKAVNFYRQWGFEFCGSHPFLLGNDLQTDMLMKKVL